jgi:hypothetical protein
VVGVFFVSICDQTVFHFMEASVVDVDEIWGKGNRFMSEIGE